MDGVVRVMMPAVTTGSRCLWRRYRWMVRHVRHRLRSYSDEVEVGPTEFTLMMSTCDFEIVLMKSDFSDSQTLAVYFGAMMT